MPPKKKKAPCNAFYYFMLDFRQLEEKKGRCYQSLADVTTPAGNEWERMSAAERAPYDQKAKDAKRQAREGDAKYTTTGERIDHVINRDLEKQNARLRMEENIMNYVQKNVTPNGFVDKVFYVAHVNYYCEVVGQDRYYPAEIAAVRFSLRHGVDSEDVFHVIFNTGEVNRGTVYEELPIGYRLMAETVAKESHQIPPPPHKPELGSTIDIKRSFSQFIDFLRQDLDPNEPTPPVYVETKNDIVAKNVFNWMLYEFGYDEHLIKIYSLPYLFFCLRNAAHKYANPDDAQNAFVNHSLATYQLERDVYDYVKGICCPFHALSDSFPYCSLSRVVRQIYIICDFCCTDVGIELIPGSHVPKSVDMKKLERKAQAKTKKPVQMLPPYTPTDTSDVESIGSAMASTTISETASVRSRQPRAQSRLVGLQFNNVPDFENDFPELPGTGRSLRGNPLLSMNQLPKGRGRGRILQK